MNLYTREKKCKVRGGGGGGGGGVGDGGGGGYNQYSDSSPAVYYR
jgi:hypothetical protein